MTAPNDTPKVVDLSKRHPEAGFPVDDGPDEDFPDQRVEEVVGLVHLPAKVSLKLREEKGLVGDGPNDVEEGFRLTLVLVHDTTPHSARLGAASFPAVGTRFCQPERRKVWSSEVDP